MAGSRGGRRGGREGGRAPLPRDVQISKKISWLLRHGAESEGLKLQEGGYVNVQDMLNNQKFKSLKVTFAEVRDIVGSNDKQRFTLTTSSPELTTEPSDNPADYLIRANQGHSLKVDSSGLLTPISADTVPETAVHGTTHGVWCQIVASGGLKPMNRNHIHFASGLPAGFSSIAAEGAGDEGNAAAPVISGMRNTSSVLVYVDVAKAMKAGVKFWLSDNGVILSEGNEQGLLPLALLKRVEDRTGEGVLLQDGEIVKEAPSSWVSKKGKP